MKKEWVRMVGNHYKPQLVGCGWVIHKIRAKARVGRGQLAMRRNKCFGLLVNFRVPLQIERATILCGMRAV